VRTAVDAVYDGARNVSARLAIDERLRGFQRGGKKTIWNFSARSVTARVPLKRKNAEDRYDLRAWKCSWARRFERAFFLARLTRRRARISYLLAI